MHDEFDGSDVPESSGCGGYYCSEESGHIDCADKRFPKTEAEVKAMPLTVGQGAPPAKGLASPEYKPLMRKPRGPTSIEAQADRVTVRGTFPRVNRCRACGRFINVGRIYCLDCHDCDDDQEPEIGQQGAGTDATDT